MVSSEPMRASASSNRPIQQTGSNGSSRSDIGDIGQHLATTPKPRNTCKLKTFADVEKLMVGEYLDRWLADSVKGTVKETTYANYAYVTQVHVSPALGGVKLKSLTPAHVRGFYGEKATIAITWTPTTTWYRQRPHRARHGRRPRRAGPR
jgi:Phage integrase, N-terminal SAM-like domain